jgi:hypothetical protein
VMLVRQRAIIKHALCVFVALPAAPAPLLLCSLLR